MQLLLLEALLLGGGAGLPGGYRQLVTRLAGVRLLLTLELQLLLTMFTLQLWPWVLRVGTGGKGRHHGQYDHQ